MNFYLTFLLFFVFFSKGFGEKFSAIEELVTLSENEDKIAMELESFIEGLEKVAADFKR